jgi:sugar phosphate isomerase/epimerase
VRRGIVRVNSNSTSRQAWHFDALQLSSPASSTPHFLAKETVMSDPKLGRRDFFKVGSVSALGASMALGAEGTLETSSAAAVPSHEKQFPQLALITRYSPQKLAFAAATHYQGVVIQEDDFFNPRLTDSQIDDILSTARQTGVRIISIEAMQFNHIARDANERRQAQRGFLDSIELAHRLGCKFIGTFSGGMEGASVTDQVKAFAGAVNETYLPVLEKLDMTMGWENYPCPVNFATVPGIWDQVFDLVPNPRLGLEFDPSHLVRQYIDPVAAAWNIRGRILGVHAKDTEITQPVLQKVGIHGKGWWRYRIPGQGLIDWPAFITVLLQAGFGGGIAVEHEDPFWDEPPSNNAPDFPQARKDGFILAYRFLHMYLPGRLS